MARRYALALDEAGGLAGPLSGLLAAGFSLASSFVLDVDDGELQELDDDAGREVAAGLGHFPEAVAA